MDIFHERIGELFHEAKSVNCRLNQTNFAIKFGASRSQLRGWLSGDGVPNTNMLRTIAKECNVSIDWLIGGTNVRTPIDEIIKNNTHALAKSDTPANPQNSTSEKIVQEETMNIITSEELLLLKQYRLMDEYQKELLEKLIEAIISMRKTNE